MAPVTEARWLALPPRLRLTPPAGADGVAAASSCRCNVAELVFPVPLLLFLRSSASLVLCVATKQRVRVDKNFPIRIWIFLLPVMVRSLPAMAMNGFR